MDARDVLREAASRPATEAKALVNTLPDGVLNAHADGHARNQRLFIKTSLQIHLRIRIIESRPFFSCKYKQFCQIRVKER